MCDNSNNPTCHFLAGLFLCGDLNDIYPENPHGIIKRGLRKTTFIDQSSRQINRLYNPYDANLEPHNHYKSSTDKISLSTKRKTIMQNRKSNKCSKDKCKLDSKASNLHSPETKNKLNGHIRRGTSTTEMEPVSQYYTCVESQIYPLPYRQPNSRFNQLRSEQKCVQRIGTDPILNKEHTTNPSRVTFQAIAPPNEYLKQRFPQGTTDSARLAIRGIQLDNKMQEPLINKHEPMLEVLNPKVDLRFKAALTLNLARKGATRLGENQPTYRSEFNEQESITSRSYAIQIIPPR